MKELDTSSLSNVNENDMNNLSENTPIRLSVTLKDVDIPFFRMVVIILKWSLASIPALILLWTILFFVGLVLGAGGLLPA